MADIATIWDAVNARGDWQVTPPPQPVVLGDGVGDALGDTLGDLIAIAAPGTNVQLVSDQDLTTSVLISLFTDRVAAPDDVIPDGTTDPRGWWADASAAAGSPAGAVAGANAATYPIGSRLWLLGDAKAVSATLLKARGYIAEALQWLIDDGVASAVDVVCEWTRPNMLGARITLWQPSGPPKVFSFANVWSQIANPPASSLTAAAVAAASPGSGGAAPPGGVAGTLDYRRPGNPLGRIIR